MQNLFLQNTLNWKNKEPVSSKGALFFRDWLETEHKWVWQEKNRERVISVEKKIRHPFHDMKITFITSYMLMYKE